ncbi:hypothetical protein [Halocatena marina]|uniref:hypothetical protein n=1 Tax=Halocatena marina TaxID=2934937 RepID=UPI00200CD4EB|nr:hypothetical protein [Halocatena marina]
MTVGRHADSMTDYADGAQTLLQAVDTSTVGLNWQPRFDHDREQVLATAEFASLVNHVHL